MRPEVFSREQVQAWEQRWFAAGNSSYGLMQQAAWQMMPHIVQYIDSLKQDQAVQHQASIGMYCGAGNNGGDGWLLAAYLKRAGFSIWVYEVEPPHTDIAKQAKAYAIAQQVRIFYALSQLPFADIQIDALFGIGLNRKVGGAYQLAIEQFNQGSGYKVALDIPSGLDANSGAVLGIACEVNLTLTVLGLKAGLLTGQGPAYAGKVISLSLIPPDDQVQVLARLDQQVPQLPKRRKTGHKGTYGHVLIVGGDENMGGAAIMAAEAALAGGAGKVTLLTHEKHHSAVLSRCPNVMTLAMPALAQITAEFAAQVSQSIDCIVIGMGLGRHDWSKAIWQAFLPVLEQAEAVNRVVIDADALWHLSAEHLADEHDLKTGLHQHWFLTPHSGETARLLGTTMHAIEQDRIAAIYALKEKFGGNWLLKGAGSLSLDGQGLSICGLGNPGMATAGMGDILAGMAGGLLAQLPNLPLHEIVTLHAAAGDIVAKQGERGLQAPQMIEAIKQVVN
ncbi:bifunctional ADP-dependent NAD(P)H-hydrate dehydratase/NAD(P)H-hydrate epimerase [Alkanindiges illinoisensis]|uniref:bifunctional ADP-dependent NAD(P)H-hydrate dehydratase/NAD(P)H-hydrate epimerase n=1 Tax=Alkanindiges illinoisensis TaxID=197183 RepID=UPI00047DA2C8|nr:bifunctional ADP-dependent NAD(P)H-hydrate dehydratase/NAD(P)H-hydrate epimerase [Alkanindiges illinoisensis]